MTQGFKLFNKYMTTKTKSIISLLFYKPCAAQWGTHLFFNCGKKRKCGSNLAVPPRLQLAAAYSPSIAAADVGLQMGIDPHTVARARCVTAGATLEYQCALVAAEARRERLDFAYEVCAFDGTRQALSIVLDPLLTADQQKSSWECMATRRILCWGTKGPNATVRTFEFSTPPCPMINTDAGSLMEALRLQPQSRPLCELIDSVLDSADFAISIRGTDGAKSVAKYLAHEETALIPAERAYAAFLCMVHANHLVVGFVVVMVSMRVVSVLYSASILLATGGYYLRMVLTVRWAVQELYNPLAAPASAEDIRLCREFLLMTSVGGFEDDASTKRRDENIDEFLSVFNAGFRAWVSNDALCHYCTGPQCCAAPWVTKLRMVKSVLVFLLGRRPDVPQLARWLLLEPAVVFFLRLAVIHRLMHTLVVNSFRDIRCKLNSEVRKADMARREVNEQAVLDEFHWHAASGRRLADTQSFFCDFSNVLLLYFMVLVVSPLAYISFFLLKDRAPEDPPLLVDLENDAFSPIILVMQYMSALLTFRHDRMLILVILAGFTTAEDLYRDKVDSFSFVLSLVYKNNSNHHNIILNIYKANI